MDLFKHSHDQSSDIHSTGPPREPGSPIDYSGNAEPPRKRFGKGKQIVSGLVAGAVIVGGAIIVGVETSKSSSKSTPEATNSGSPAPSRHPKPQDSSPTAKPTPKPTKPKPVPSQKTYKPVGANPNYEFTTKGRATLEDLGMGDNSLENDAASGLATFENFYPNVFRSMASGNPRDIGSALCAASVQGLEQQRDSDPAGYAFLTKVSSSGYPEWNNAWTSAQDEMSQNSSLKASCTFVKATKSELAGIFQGGDDTIFKKAIDSPNQISQMDTKELAYLVGGHLELATKNSDGSVNQVLYDQPVFLQTNAVEIHDQAGDIRPYNILNRLIDANTWNDPASS